MTPAALMRWRQLARLAKGHAAVAPRKNKEATVMRDEARESRAAAPAPKWPLKPPEAPSLPPAKPIIQADGSVDFDVPVRRKTCGAVDRKTGKACTLPLHPGEHSASGIKFTRALRPGEKPEASEVEVRAFAHPTSPMEGL